MASTEFAVTQQTIALRSQIWKVARHVCQANLAVVQNVATGDGFSRERDQKDVKERGF
jgi:hypothetical protein